LVHYKRKKKQKKELSGTQKDSSMFHPSIFHKSTIYVHPWFTKVLIYGPSTLQKIIIHIPSTLIGSIIHSPSQVHPLCKENHPCSILGSSTVHKRIIHDPSPVHPLCIKESSMVHSWYAIGISIHGPFTVRNRYQHPWFIHGTK
jgi:hypothetical protein